MTETQTRPSGISRLFARLTGQQFEEEEEIIEDDAPRSAGSYSTTEVNVRTVATHRYHITIRKSTLSFEEAVMAADGLKKGEQQILNLTLCQPDLREKILNFMYGAAYLAEADMQELGEHVWLFAPASAYVEVAAPTKRKKDHSFN